MAIIKMMAIEYNILLSIMKLIDNTIKSSIGTYDCLSKLNVPVLPAYPRNLTNFTKPSIIVQKVGTDNEQICFGGFIGQYQIDDMQLDAYGTNYESTYQIDVCGDNSTQKSLLVAILMDEMFNNIRFNNCGQIEIHNYALSQNNPQLMGYAKLDQDIDIQDIDRKYRAENEYKPSNYDYVTAIRFDVSMLQVIVPDNQKMIDLTKPIKITQRVKL